jgi:hypothetical protein
MRGHGRARRSARLFYNRALGVPDNGVSGTRRAGKRDAAVCGDAVVVTAP